MLCMPNLTFLDQSYTKMAYLAAILYFLRLCTIGRYYTIVYLNFPIPKTPLQQVLSIFFFFGKQIDYSDFFIILRSERGGFHRPPTATRGHLHPSEAAFWKPHTHTYHHAKYPNLCQKCGIEVVYGILA